MGIVKVGPCGGHQGESQDMTPDDVNHITKMIIGHGCAIDSIYFVYQFNNGSQREKKFGGQTGQQTQIYFAPDEYITNVSGHYGEFDHHVVLRSLKIETNHHQGLSAYGPFGVEEGLAFNLPTYGGKIIGFHGGAGTYLNALGVYVRYD